MQEADESVRWKAFDMADLKRQRQATRQSYLSFLEVPSLTSGLYVLPAGSVDTQSPHEFDEVYYVLTGKARFTVGAGEQAKETEVRGGAVLYVKAEEPHHFHDIDEDLEVLVFFSRHAAP